jgi:hypothetical protein
MDVLNALDTLAADPPELVDGRDQRWPALGDAVHWLVDDTWWDHRNPSESVGTILRTEQEAAAVGRVVAAVVAVSERQGPAAPDADWFSDEAWAEVQSTAQEAAAALRTE